MSDQNILNAKYATQTSYPLNELQTQIVHLGFGAFHRGHQAVYNDLTNQVAEERWGICEINMFGDSKLVDDLKEQQLHFTVIEKSASTTTSRLVRTVTEAIHTPDEGIEVAIAKMVEPQIKIVSLTITEKGYCVDPQTRQLDESNVLIKQDLQTPRKPCSAIGLIVEALNQRMQSGMGAFSVMSCDNIPENGHLTRDAVLAFAAKRSEELKVWIENNTTFPSTMVDRIVPAMTSDQYDVIKQETGYRDPCGVVCEDFRQWVIEDNFVAGRPSWEKAGAMLVEDVLPYEEMKLRMLNGSHSFLAYNGSLAGYDYIYECMQDENFKKATYFLMTQEQAKSLSPKLNVNLEEYAQLLIERFSNSNIKHKTAQIAMDGSQKLPQRAVDPYLTLLERGIEPKGLSVLIAGWLQYVITTIESGNQLEDPLASVFSLSIKESEDPTTQALALLAIEKVFGTHGTENRRLVDAVTSVFKRIDSDGIQATVTTITA